MLFEIGSGKHLTCSRSSRIEFNRVDFDRFCNVLQVLSTQLTIREIELAFNLIHDLARNTNAAALNDAFETGCNVHAISEYVVAITNYVPDVNANSVLYAFVLRYLGVMVRQAPLHLHSIPDCVHHAGKLV